MGDPWGAEGFTETLPSPFTGQISTNYLFGEIQSLFCLITLMALFAFDIWLLRFKSTKIQLLFKGKVKSLSCVRLFATSWTAAHQAPPSVGFFRQEYWNGLPFPSPRDRSNPGIKLTSLSSPELARGFWSNVIHVSHLTVLVGFIFLVFDFIHQDSRSLKC